jgi:hypothetical protein
MQIAWRGARREEYVASNLVGVNPSLPDERNNCNEMFCYAEPGEAAQLRGSLMAPENVHVTLVS